MKMKVMVFLMAVILSAALPGCTAGATESRCRQRQKRKRRQIKKL